MVQLASAEVMATQALVVGRAGRSIARVPDVELGPGDTVLLLGPSGCGKSTTLFTLAGLLTPVEGTVRLDERPFSACPPLTRDRLRGRRMGLVFQDASLIAGLSVMDNVLLGPFACGVRADRLRATHLLGRLGIGALADRRVERLSRGEAQRVATARALQMRPGVILADEPTSGLDDAHAAATADLLAEAASETGAALIIATHDARLRARFGRVLDLEPTR